MIFYSDNGEKERYWKWIYYILYYGLSVKWFVLKFGVINKYMIYMKIIYIGGCKYWYLEIVC